MVQVIIQPRPPGYYWWQQPTGTPEIHLHSVERHVHGNGIKIVVHGEVKIQAGEIIYARELKLNTLEVMKFTPEYQRQPTDIAYIVSKWIYRKGEYDNWASIDVYDDAHNWMGPGRQQYLPSQGSIWLDFNAKGE